MFAKHRARCKKAEGSDWRPSAADNADSSDSPGRCDWAPDSGAGDPTLSSARRPIVAGATPDWTSHPPPRSWSRLWSAVCARARSAGLHAHYPIHPIAVSTTRRGQSPRSTATPLHPGNTNHGGTISPALQRGPSLGSSQCPGQFSDPAGRRCCCTRLPSSARAAGVLACWRAGWRLRRPQGVRGPDPARAESPCTLWIWTR